MATTTEHVQQRGKEPMEARVARAFGLDGDGWMRHANPLSVWSRFSCLSLIALAIWSRTWFGWLSVVAIGLAVVWMVGNPRLFPPPRSTRGWASKGVFGERIWAARNTVAIPDEFASRIPNLANAYSAIGVALLGYGLVTFNVVAVVAGLVITHGGKLWYLDRMVLLFDNMKGRHPEYARWEHDAS